LTQSYGPGRIFFCDEMRSGTRSQCKSRWSYKGRRPICKMKLGYEFCYLYTALCPSTGHLLALILPDMSKDSFCIFCRFFSEQVNVSQNPPVLMIADGAGAHQKQVCLKEGFYLEHLPTACPELNPVERFFEEVRKEMSNQIFDTIENVEQHLSQVLKKYFHNKNKIIQLTNYPYIRTQ
jgi:transposase